LSIDACAALVHKGDPDRFLSAMTAPPADRAPLLVLYAFNLEIARATWVAQEEMLAEMRLQFWADLISDAANGGAVPPHEVGAPLADLVRNGLPEAPLQAMIEGRRLEIRHAAPPADDLAVFSYLDATAGNLMWLAAGTLGASATAEGPVRDVAAASGLAALFLALPALMAAGRAPLPDLVPNTGDAVLARLAATALGKFRAAKAQRHLIPRTAAPALRAGWMAAPTLARARRWPGHVRANTLAPSAFQKRLRLLSLSLTGRW